MQSETRPGTTTPDVVVAGAGVSRVSDHYSSGGKRVFIVSPFHYPDTLSLHLHVGVRKFTYITTIRLIQYIRVSCVKCPVFSHTLLFLKREGGTESRVFKEKDPVYVNGQRTHRKTYIRDGYIRKFCVCNISAICVSKQRMKKVNILYTTTKIQSEISRRSRTNIPKSRNLDDCKPRHP